jgi:hypothetical protein
MGWIPAGAMQKNARAKLDRLPPNGAGPKINGKLAIM